MINPVHVIEGHINLALSKTPLANSEVEQLSALRLDICAGCKKDNQPCLVNAHCCRCGCDMEAKSRVNASKLCPIGLW